MAAGGGSSASGAGPSTPRVTRGEKRERESSAGLPRSASKRSRMAEGGAEREGEEEESEEEAHSSVGRADSQSRSEDTEPKVEHPSDICPITDKDEKPFRLMDMPPEIRIEIYRACLTRPFDVLLSRQAKPAETEKQREGETRESEDVGDVVDPEDDHAVVSRSLPRNHISSNDGASDQEPAGAASASASASGVNAWSARGMRALRSLTRSNLQRHTNALADNAANPPSDNNDNPAPTPGNRSTTTTTTNVHNNFPPRRRTVFFPSGNPTNPPTTTRAPRPQDADPLHVNLLRTSKLVYKEARAILYGENTFLLDLDTAQPTLAALHQRSRGQIKNLRVTIPTHNEILERFSEVVRLSLRYCWRLKRFVIYTPFVLPGAEGSSTSGNTTVYANAFDILRWLPRQCEVVLEGNVSEEIRRVVEKNSNLAKSLDEVSYFSLYAFYGLEGYLRREGGMGGGGG